MLPDNHRLLQELNTARLWFHAGKRRPIWIRRLERETTIQTLEGPEEVPAGTYLCRGEAAELWPQSEDRITAKYVLTDEFDAEGWRKCIPRADIAGVLAAQVPRAFQVQSKWGLLSGKAGDYVVKSYEDRDNDNPADVWIVDQRLFKATYERVND